jgi:hypothetical protein
MFGQLGHVSMSRIGVHVCTCQHSAAGRTRTGNRSSDRTVPYVRDPANPVPNALLRPNDWSVNSDASGVDSAKAIETPEPKTDEALD